MTFAALTEASGLSRKSLSDFENGKKEPSPESVERLATALAVRYSYFMLPALEEVPVEAVSFRAPTKMTARNRDMAIAVSSHAVELRGWIDANYETPAVDVPTLDKFFGIDGAAQAAGIVRARWGLGEAPLGNMVHLLELHGVAVFTINSEKGALDAYSFRSAGQPYVLLSPHKSAERGRFDAAHELGHLVLHSGPACTTGVEAEREADAFASAFLMPEADVRATMGVNPNVNQIIDRKRRWRVSAMALAYRLHDLDLLSDWLYHTTCVNLSRMGYRSGEPVGIGDRESSMLLHQVMADIRSIRGGFDALCEELGVEAHDINDLVFNLAPVSISGANQSSAPIRPALHVVQ